MKKPWLLALVGLAFVGLVTGNVHGRTWHVKADGTGDAPTIQAGIDSADVGDLVLLAPGTFAGPGNGDVSYLGKTITVTSAGGAEVTIIDCQGATRGFRFEAGEPSDAVLSRVKIANGVVGLVVEEGLEGFDPRVSVDQLSNMGGGILVMSGSPTIDGVIISNCRGSAGGGVFCGGGTSPTIRNSTIENCTASLGGGICYFSIEAAIIQGSCIQNNAAAMGGGIYCTAGARVQILGNDLLSNSASYYGGGIYCFDGSNPSILGNTIDSNIAAGVLGSGGGIYCSPGSAPLIGNNVISNNAYPLVGPGPVGGGGIFVKQSSPRIVGNRFVANGLRGSPRGDGGAILVSEGFPEITGNVFRENQGDEGSAISIGNVADPGHPVIVEDNIFYNNYCWTTGTISVNTAGEVIIRNCTLSENGTRPTACSGIWVAGVASDIVIDRTIIAFGTAGKGLMCAGQGPTVRCCDLFGNSEGDGICGVNGGGNFSLDPDFCGLLGTANYYLQSDSPCGPGHHPSGDDCGLIGALPGNCGAVATEKSTWGTIKSLYKKDG